MNAEQATNILKQTEHGRHILEVIASDDLNVPESAFEAWEKCTGEEEEAADFLLIQSLPPEQRP